MRNLDNVPNQPHHPSFSAARGAKTGCFGHNRVLLALPARAT
jgi:hypothetical protein